MDSYTFTFVTRDDDQVCIWPEVASTRVHDELLELLEHVDFVTVIKN